MERLIHYFVKLPVLFQLSTISSVFPIVAALFVFRSLGRDLRILLGYEITSLLVITGQAYLAAQIVNNLWLAHIFTPIEFALLIWMFSLWQDEPNMQRFYRLTIPVFIFFWALLEVFVEKLTEFNTVSKPTEAIMLIIASGYSLYKVNKEKVESLFRQPSFWISSGTLIFFTGTVILFTVTNLLLQESKEGLMAAWQMVIVMNIVANLFYVTGFLCKRSTQV